MDDGGRVRAVLVDDHRAVRDVVRAFLELDGRTDVVGEAGDGGEAVEVIRETRPDVVVMDLEMPVANGLEVSAAVRRDLPDTRVVLFSSVPSVSREVQDEHRVDAFVRKDWSRRGMMTFSARRGLTGRQGRQPYFLPLLRPIRNGVGPSYLRQALVQRVGQHVVLRAVQLDVAVEVGLDAPGGLRSAEREVAQPEVAHAQARLAPNPLDDRVIPLGRHRNSRSPR